MPSLLDYGRARPDRGRLLWRLGLLVLGAALVVGAGRYADDAACRARLLYWQGRCLDYAPPADFVVYEEGPGAAARLASGAYVPRVAPLADGPAAAHVPECLTRLVAEALPARPGLGNAVPLFVHARTDANGREWLVTVLYLPDDCDGFSGAVNLSATVSRPTPVVGRRNWLMPSSGRCDAYRRGSKGRTLVIYAGQADPADPAGFTIRYVRNGVAGVLHGRVEPTGSYAVVRMGDAGPGGR